MNALPRILLVKGKMLRNCHDALILRTRSYGRPSQSQGNPHQNVRPLSHFKTSAVATAQVGLLHSFDVSGCEAISQMGILQRIKDGLS